MIETNIDVADPFQRRPRRCVPNGHRGRLSRLLVISIALVLLSSACLPAQQSNPGEYEVKAVYLYDFAKFVTWPANVTTAGEFTICVLGVDPFGATLDAITAGERINGKKIAINRIAKPQEAVSCHILFISSSEESQLKEILATLDKTSVLTVSDISQFTRRGGMIQFVVEANKVRFEVNVTSAERGGLVLSSQLLKVAINVRRGSPAGD
jgi:YfiR/HmsC-like